MLELVHAVPVLQEEDDKSAHVCPVDQEVRGERVATDDVILAPGFRVRKDPGLPLLRDVSVGAFAFENVQLKFAVESGVKVNLMLIASDKRWVVRGV